MGSTKPRAWIPPPAFDLLLVFRDYEAVISRGWRMTAAGLALPITPSPEPVTSTLLILNFNCNFEIFLFLFSHLLLSVHL